MNSTMKEGIDMEDRNADRARRCTTGTGIVRSVRVKMYVDFVVVRMCIGCFFYPNLSKRQAPAT